MDVEDLRAMQAPLKSRYRDDPGAAAVTLKARGTLGTESLTCRVEAPGGPVEAGLHPATGGDGLAACSGNILLEALVACAGVTLCAVATALELTVRGGTLTVEGDLDFRGTLALDKEVPVGFQEIRLHFNLDTNASQGQLETLKKLTERYCVVWNTLSVNCRGKVHLGRLES